MSDNEGRRQKVEPQAKIQVLISIILLATATIFAMVGLQVRQTVLQNSQRNNSQDQRIDGLERQVTMLITQMSMQVKSTDDLTQQVRIMNDLLQRDLGRNGH